MQSDRPALAREPTRRRILLAAIIAGIAVAAVAVLAATGVLGSRSQPPAVAEPSRTHQSQSPEREGDVFGTGVAESCVEMYSTATLTKRGFAFDGTVVGIGERSSAAEVADPYVPVTFTVTRWFHGGPSDQITVAMFSPDSVTSVESTTYTVGSRLLVSGEDRWGGSPMDSPIAWACGFTRWYNQADAQSWDQASANGRTGGGARRAPRPAQARLGWP